MDDTDTCPFCKETIKKQSLKCKHCQSVLVPLNENIGRSSGGDSIQIISANQESVKRIPNESWVTPITMNLDPTLETGG